MRRLQKYIGDVRLGQLCVGQVASLRRRMELAGEAPENQRATMVRLSTILNVAVALIPMALTAWHWVVSG